MMAVAGVSSLAQAKDVSVDTLRHAGPYVVRQPLMIDSTDVKSNKHSPKNGTIVLEKQKCGMS